MSDNSIAIHRDDRLARQHTDDPTVAWLVPIEQLDGTSAMTLILACSSGAAQLKSLERLEDGHVALA